MVIFHAGIGGGMVQQDPVSWRSRLISDIYFGMVAMAGYYHTRGLSTGFNNVDRPLKSGVPVKLQCSEGNH